VHTLVIERERGAKAIPTEVVVNRIQRSVAAAVAGLLCASSSAAQSVAPDPGPRLASSSGARVAPDGLRWTGLTCQRTTGCACPSDGSRSFRAACCTAGGKIPFGNPLLTLTWVVGQVNLGGGPMTASPLAAGSCPPVSTLHACLAGAVAWATPRR
jgi:hypothetical protein